MSRKKLTKAESKQLYICRERVHDALVRCCNIADIIQKRDWPEYEFINEGLHGVNNLEKKLEELETIQYKLEYNK